MNRLNHLALCALLLGACTGEKLYSVGSQPNLADRISLQGELCTDDPSAVAFPVKVLVVIDGTATLVGADPMATRVGALQTLLGRYSGPNYHFGFIQFTGLARNLTSGFPTDITQIQPALDAIGVGTGDAQRNLLDALRATSAAVSDDLLASTPGARSRTRYVVLFLAAGPPTPALGDAFCMQRLLDPKSAACKDAFTKEYCATIQPAPADCESAVYQRAASDLRAFALSSGAADLVFDTFALTADARTNELLAAVATASRGTFERQSPDALNLLRTDISASSSVLQPRQVVVYNPNMVLRDGRPAPDSDEDGLPDELEAKAAIGTDPARADTDGDFVGDGIELRLAAPGLSFDPRVPHVPDACLTIDPPDRDSDADGLSDCEEAVLRTDPSLVDSDKDGLPDLVEVRRGSNPLVDDLLTDSDRDGIPNGEEVRAGLSAVFGDATYELEYGYRYRLFDEGVKMRLEAVPTTPIAGVRIEAVNGSTPLVGRVRFEPGPPATLAWTADANNAKDPGAAVDVSKGGRFDLVSSPVPAGGTRTLSVTVTPALLPAVAKGRVEAEILVRPTVRSCFHLDVRNIPLVETMEIAGGRPGRGWNVLQVWLAEVPQSSPGGNSIFDLATVPMRFLAPDKKTPNVPFITLDPDSFVLLEGNP